MTLKDLEKRLEKEPDNLPLRVTVAGMMSDAGRKADAVEHYRRVAMAYRTQGRPQQALAVARSILEIAPNDVAIQTLVAELTEPPKPPAPKPEERKPSMAEPTKTGVRTPPEPRSAAEMSVPDLDDLDTKPPAATGSRPPGTMLPKGNTGPLRAISTTRGPKTTPPVIRIPEKKSDSQPPASATFRSQPPPPPRRTPIPEEPGLPRREGQRGVIDELTAPGTSAGAPRRSSFDMPTPLPQPVPYHLADPTSSQDRLSRDEVPGLDEPGLPRRGSAAESQRGVEDDALETRPGDDPNQSGGLAQAARRISSLIKPRSEKPTRNPFTPDPTLRADAPPQPTPARTAKPALDPYADKPLVPRSDKPTRQPPLGRTDKPTQNPFAPDRLAPPAKLDKLPSIARPVPVEPSPTPPRPPAMLPREVPLRPAPAPTLPARTPPVTSTSKTQPRPAQLVPPDDARETQPRPAQPMPPDDAIKAEPQPALPRLGDTFRAQPPPAGPAPMLPVARPPLRPSSAGPPTLKADPPPAGRVRPRPSVPAPARDTGSSGVRSVPRPARDTGSSGTRVDKLPPAPEPGADHLPPPPAVPQRAPSVVPSVAPRTPSYSDEMVAELDTRERPRLSSDDLDKIASPPPTVPTEQVVLDDDQVTPPPQEWPERRARAGGPPIRDTPMDPPTDVHTSLARDTNLDMQAESRTDVQRSGRDTRRDAAAEPPEDERTAPRELVGPEPLANAFFLSIPLNRRDAALTRCIRRIVRAGQTVIRQGETSHPLYLVVTGQLELRIERANGTLAKLDEIDAGQYVGEASLLARTPAIAHVIASANSELLALPPHALFELAGAYPALWAALKDSAERRSRMYEKLLYG